MVFEHRCEGSKVLFMGHMKKKAFEAERIATTWEEMVLASMNVEQQGSQCHRGRLSKK